jgi:Uncharacterized conserved protein (COG2071)
VIRTRLRRHPLPIRSHFDFALVLTYALPATVLEPLLLPGLTLDRFGDRGFVAVALVQTRNLRPAFLPSFAGLDFFLAGYRIFTRYDAGGRTLRGLQILRSRTDSRIMTFFGNLLTHYNYSRARVEVKRDGARVEVAIGDELDVVADLVSEAALPPGSPFADWKTARRYAGPLPFTFDHERETNSIVRIEGVRQEWKPRPVNVELRHISFFAQPAFADATPVLASAFYFENIPYLWRRGVVAPLDAHG